MANSNVKEIIELLKKEYPDALCSLDYKDPLQLLIATRLAAQCTDARVNTVTPALFEKYKCVEDFANADLKDVENIVRPCGFYHTKANDIINLSKKIISDFSSKVPDNIEDLTTLSGIGRKTANIICGDIFGKPSIAADTHCIRISNRIGFINTKNPHKVELELRKIIPDEESTDYCHRCVLHGRAVCTSRKAKCDECIIKDFCNKEIG